MYKQIFLNFSSGPFTIKTQGIESRGQGGSTLQRLLDKQM